MRKSAPAVALGLLMALAAPATPSAAYAASYLNEAVQALQSGSVYVSPLAPGTNAGTKAQLERQIGGSDIAVAVLPREAVNETGGDIVTFTREVAVQSGKPTVVVSLGGDLEAVSTVLPTGKASQLANAAERETPSVETALGDFIAEVRTGKAPQPPQASVPEEGEGGFGLLSILGLVLLLIGVFLVFRLWVRMQGSSGSPRVKSQAPDTVKALLAEIVELSQEVQDTQMRKHLDLARIDTEQLFIRLKRSGSNRIHEITAMYEGSLKAIRDVLVKYLDIQENPRYFEKPQDRLAEGREAAAQLAAGVLKNVQEVERGALTDFRVNTKILTASKFSDPVI